jgi:hypothetical protein
MQDNWQKRPRVPKDNAHPTDAPQWYSRGYVPHFDMPNHVHTLFSSEAGWTLSQIAHSWKSYTANECNRLLKRKGEFWQRETFDRYIRNEQHYENVVKYIKHNPVKAGLCARPEDWRWSSAYLGAQAYMPAATEEDPS